MAAVPVEIRGTLYDLATKSARQVFIQGSAVRSDVSIGGGPIIPPSGGNGDHIWGGGNVPMPSPPIANVPGAPGYIPPKPTEPPPDGADKPPPETGGWGYVAEWNEWGYFPGTSNAAPK